MKVKEIPKSLLTQRRLKAASLSELTRDKPQIPVVVSLASIPSRLDIVHITIKSILNQTVLPKHLMLWLHMDLKGKLPNTLTELEGELFSIQFTTYASSHRKLVEPLKQFPNLPIITCDDDMMYRKNWLENLYSEHKKYPNAILANQARNIAYDDEGTLLPYHQWTDIQQNKKTKNTILPIGAGGTLYPPNVLDKRVTKEALFMELAPKADDLWFKAMGLLKGTESRRSENPTKEPIPIFGSQKESLKKTNIDQDKNTSQWRALDAYFGLFQLMQVNGTDSRNQ
ncbi:MAG: zinc-binding alcohol dehydrogenase [Bacteroidota bacterium]